MDQDTLQMSLIVAGVISLVILYFIIKGAARAGNSEVERLLRIIINMKSEEMKKQGFTNDEISSIINRVK